jgi:hypothetical protein
MDGPPARRPRRSHCPGQRRAHWRHVRSQIHHGLRPPRRMEVALRVVPRPLSVEISGYFLHRSPMACGRLDGWKSRCVSFLGHCLLRSRATSFTACRCRSVRRRWASGPAPSTRCTCFSVTWEPSSSRCSGRRYPRRREGHRVGDGEGAPPSRSRYRHWRSQTEPVGTCTGE